VLMGLVEAYCIAALYDVYPFQEMYCRADLNNYNPMLYRWIAKDRPLNCDLLAQVTFISLIFEQYFNKATIVELVAENINLYSSALNIMID